MAGKSYIETDRQVRDLVAEVKAGVFKPVYLLMGEEPYYPDLVCNAIIDCRSGRKTSTRPSATGPMWTPIPSSRPPAVSP